MKKILFILLAITVIALPTQYVRASTSAYAKAVTQTERYGYTITIYSDYNTNSVISKYWIYKNTLYKINDNSIAPQTGIQDYGCKWLIDDIQDVIPDCLGNAYYERDGKIYIFIASSSSRFYMDKIVSMSRDSNGFAILTYDNNSDYYPPNYPNYPDYPNYPNVPYPVYPNGNGYPSTNYPNYPNGYYPGNNYPNYPSISNNGRFLEVTSTGTNSYTYKVYEYTYYSKNLITTLYVSGNSVYTITNGNKVVYTTLEPIWVGIDTYLNVYIEDAMRRKFLYPYGYRTGDTPIMLGVETSSNNYQVFPTDSSGFVSWDSKAVTKSTDIYNNTVISAFKDAKYNVIQYSSRVVTDYLGHTYTRNAKSASMIGITSSLNTFVLEKGGKKLYKYDYLTGSRTLYNKRFSIKQLKKDSKGYAIGVVTKSGKTYKFAKLKNLQ